MLRQIESRISELQDVLNETDNKRNAMESAYFSTIEEIKRESLNVLADHKKKLEESVRQKLANQLEKLQM